MTDRPDPPDRLPIDEVRPSQLYLSADKLADVIDWFDFANPHGSYGSLPVFSHEGEWFLSDGHTRAFVAHLAGVEELVVERDDEVWEVYDSDLYVECVGWCRDEGVDSPADLAGRVLAHDRFEEAWIDRCQRAAERREE